MRALSALAAASLFAIVGVTPAGATTYDVNRTDDPAGAGCLGGGCSLRQAVAQVSAGAGSGDTINLPAGHYMLTIASNLTTSKSVTIVGAGARSTVIDANLGARAIYFNAGTNSMSGVTFTGGKGSSAGAISNSGTLALTDVAVIGNEATGTGGGISNNLGSTLTIAGSTIAGNKAGTVGGGIYSNGTLTLTNSTVSGNSAAPTWSAGGIYSNGATTIASSTIAGNSAPIGGGLYRTAGTITIGNSIVAGNTATTSRPNCFGGTTNSLGGNLEDLNDCQFTQPTDAFNTPAGLDPLADNGGPTDTRALQAGSAAIDRGVNCPPPATDQRGITRPQGPSCDSGAFEVQVNPPPVPDRTAPEISEFRLAPTTFAAAKSGGSIAAKRKRIPIGTTVTLRVSEAATALFSVDRVVKGRKSGKRCATKRRRGKRCTINRSVGSFSKSSAAGEVRFKFTGRVAGKALKPGRYRISATATDATGNKSTVRQRDFTIKRR